VVGADSTTMRTATVVEVVDGADVDGANVVADIGRNVVDGDEVDTTSGRTVVVVANRVVVVARVVVVVGRIVVVVTTIGRKVEVVVEKLGRIVVVTITRGRVVVTRGTDVVVVVRRGRSVVPVTDGTVVTGATVVAVVDVGVVVDVDVVLAVPPPPPAGAGTVTVTDCGEPVRVVFALPAVSATEKVPDAVSVDVTAPPPAVAVEVAFTVQTVLLVCTIDVIADNPAVSTKSVPPIAVAVVDSVAQSRPSLPVTV